MAGTEANTLRDRAMLVTAVVGPMQAVLELGADPQWVSRLRVQLTALCVGYLVEAAAPLR